MITNIRNLPEAIVRAIKNDPYDKGPSDFSITEILQPPRIRALKIKHKNEIVEDASERIWSLLGQSIHTILERSNNPENAIAEKRYFAKFGDYTVSAQVDSLELVSGILQDYKTTTAWKFVGNKPPSPDYIAQLNGQLEILRRNNLDARFLQIVGILRDWQIREANLNPDYPQFQVATLQIPMWSREETSSFIEDRIRVHLAAEKILPLCTQDDKWATPNKFAIMKGTNIRAVKLVDSLAEAQDYVANGLGSRIESRPGASRRCRDYCIVNKFCDQFKSENKTNKELNNANRENHSEM